jgi:diphthamide synthase subunit DPH2
MMEDRYEVSRILDEIRRELSLSQEKQEDDDDSRTRQQHRRVVGVALQFPESLLRDAPVVCREMEERWNRSNEKNEQGHGLRLPTTLLFAFCVGDSTDDDCCPDVDGALHVPGTQFLVQFGSNACLTHNAIRNSNSETGSAIEPCCHEGGSGHDKTGARRADLQREGTCCHKTDRDSGLCVLRAFGRHPMNVPLCVDRIQRMTKERAAHRRFLLLYDLRYRHAIDDLATMLSERLDALVVVGQVPSRRSAIGDDSSGAPNVVAGGLEVPVTLVDWPSYCLLYVGSTTAGSEPNSVNWQFGHISLRLHGTGISSVVTYDPSMETSGTPRIEPGSANPTDSNRITIQHPAIDTAWSPLMPRFLKRRFFLIQKARAARTVGIVVAANVGGGGGGGGAETNDGESHPGAAARRVVNALIRMLTERGRAPYLYSVGRNVTVAKLSNFADLVECFVYVACPYGTLRTLHGLDREVAVPVLTPLEMATALDCVEWNTCRPNKQSMESTGCNAGYSVDWNDFLAVARNATSALNSHSSGPESTSRNEAEASGEVHEAEDSHQEEDDDDAPYFSLVTGKYESSHAPRATARPADQPDLALLPGQGVLTTHVSTAAEALRRREFQGLRPEVGSTAIHVATPGQKGIASNYGDR